MSLNWKENNEKDKIEYYDNQKHGIIEVFVKIRLPYKFYQIAHTQSVIYNLKSFDDYVSNMIYRDIENYIRNGPDIIGDAVLNKITGEKTYWHTAATAAEEKDLIEILPSREEVDKGASEFVKDVLDNDMKHTDDQEKEDLR